MVTVIHARSHSDHIKRYKNWPSIENVLVKLAFQNETLARIICLTVFYFILANIIHLSTSCLTRVASICLIGRIEEVNGIKHTNAKCNLLFGAIQIIRDTRGGGGQQSVT